MPLHGFTLFAPVQGFFACHHYTTVMLILLFWTINFPDTNHPIFLLVFVALDIITVGVLTGIDFHFGTVMLITLQCLLLAFRAGFKLVGPVTHYSIFSLSLISLRSWFLPVRIPMELTFPLVVYSSSISPIASFTWSMGR